MLTQKQYALESSESGGLHHCLMLEFLLKVLTRCWTTLNPLTASTYAATRLSPSPDLYGPFWTLTTLIFSLFVFSSLAASIASLLSSPNQEYQYNFQLLSIAVSLVYAYGLGLPVLIWAALKYFGIGDWGLVEAVAIWGYGQFVWIPVAVRAHDFFHSFC